MINGGHGREVYSQSNIAFIQNQQLYIGIQHEQHIICYHVYHLWNIYFAESRAKIQMMSYRLFCTKKSSKSMVFHWQEDIDEKIQIKMSQTLTHENVVEIIIP